MKIKVFFIFLLITIFLLCVIFKVNYLLTACVIALSAMIPFFFSFETHSKRSHVMTLTAVMCAFAVTGRLAFFMLPQVKPICAIVIITGVCLGKESGFITGAMSAFISNFYFGQGPHTPFQMLGLAIIGLIGGIFYNKADFTKKKSLTLLSVSGAISVFLVYGGFADISTILLLSDKLRPETVLLTYTAAIPFNIINAVSTAIFLIILTKPFYKKFNRIKIKYGI